MTVPRAALVYPSNQNCDILFLLFLLSIDIMKKVMRTLSFRNNKGKENTHQTVMVFGHANFSSVNIIDRYFTDYTYG